MTKNKIDLVKIGDYCRCYRRDTLGYNLTQFCEITNSNIKSISAFENGRINNMYYITLYYKFMKTQKERVDFISKLLQL